MMFLNKKDQNHPPLKFGEISKKDLERMGADSVAYIRKPDSATDHSYKIYAGDGSYIGEEDNIKAAIAELRVNNIVCVTLH